MVENINKNTDKKQEKLYKQCLLRKRVGNLSVIDVAWIPVKYAIVGKSLKFWKDGDINDDDSEGKWDDGWIVIKVYGVRSEEDIVNMNWDCRKWDWIKE